MKSALSKKIEESTSNVLPKKKILQKENVKTPETVKTREAVSKLKSPTINTREKEKSKTAKEKKDKKTVNVIIKKSFTYIDSSASFGFFDRKEPVRKIIDKPPIPKPRLNLTKGNKPVNPISPVKEIVIPVTKPESEEKPKVKKVKRPLKPKKEWDDNFNSTKKEEMVKIKKVNFQVDAYREMMTEALATSAKKLASDREKLNKTEEQKKKIIKETPTKIILNKTSFVEPTLGDAIIASKQKIESFHKTLLDDAPVASKQKVESFHKPPQDDAPITSKLPLKDAPISSSFAKQPLDDVPIVHATEEIVEYQPIEIDKSTVVDKLRNEVAWNIISKLFINYVKKEPEPGEEPTHQIKHRWNLKCGKRKRMRATTEVEASEDSVIKLKRHNTEPHSYRGFVWRHPREGPDNVNDYSVTSLASSLKHMNTDDLEDFVFWETVPPKTTSCWEVSLYQSKRPWSVLSCSVFKSNRLSSTPGLILENLRNGRSCENRVPSNNPVRTLPRSNSFDVEPSIAQKNIDIRNWVAALNFDAPEPNPILSERNLSNEPNPAGEMTDLSKGMHQTVPSDCTLKEKKKKMKHEGKKSPGKRARSAFDDHTKMQLAIPPAENMRLVNGVFIGKNVKVIDYDKKSDVVKSLLAMNPMVKEQKCVYMMQLGKNKSASDKIRKSRDGRKSREASRGKSRERTVTPGASKLDNPMEGLVRKGSGGFVTVEQFCKTPETRERVTFQEKIVNLTDLTGDAAAADPEEKGTLQVAEPSGERVHKHECELMNCCASDSKPDGRKAAMEYGKLLLNKRLEMEARRKARAESRARSRSQRPSSIFKSAVSYPIVERINDSPSKIICAVLALIFCVLSIFYRAELIRLVF